MKNYLISNDKIIVLKQTKMKKTSPPLIIHYTLTAVIVISIAIIITNTLTITYYS
jgi:hypothetical protein